MNKIKVLLLLLAMLVNFSAIASEYTSYVYAKEAVDVCQGEGDDQNTVITIQRDVRKVIAIGDNISVLVSRNDYSTARSYLIVLKREVESIGGYIKGNSNYKVETALLFPITRIKVNGDFAKKNNLHRICTFARQDLIFESTISKLYAVKLNEIELAEVDYEKIVAAENEAKFQEMANRKVKVGSDRKEALKRKADEIVKAESKHVAHSIQTERDRLEAEGKIERDNKRRKESNAAIDKSILQLEDEKKFALQSQELESLLQKYREESVKFESYKRDNRLEHLQFNLLYVIDDDSLMSYGVILRNSNAVLYTTKKLNRGAYNAWVVRSIKPLAFKRNDGFYESVYTYIEADENSPMVTEYKHLLDNVNRSNEDYLKSKENISEKFNYKIRVLQRNKLEI
ncbi:hypothetical protein ACRN94_03720 [Shewanella baltica]|uniref:hypothetical protein n=1 Tax=Shewanella baltica TaxID=62322 RepID=UPI003D7AD030